MTIESPIQQPANYTPLTPLSFLERAVGVYPERTAVVWGEFSCSYREFATLVARLAQLLRDQGIGKGDVVSVMMPNRPEMLAAHYAVPLLGAVLNTINTRLDTEAVSYILDHGGARLILADHSCLDVAQAAAQANGLGCIEVVATPAPADQQKVYLLDTAELLPLPSAEAVTDEWQALVLNYTSGTTGNPKGVVYHHRGAYLNALGNVMSLGFNEQSVYLWTLPMFHCNGWCHTWAVTAAGGTHVCLEVIDPELIFSEIARLQVTHLSCAPVVLYMLLANVPSDSNLTHRVTVATGGAAPTATLMEQLDQIGFDLIHLYGLTESFGPQTLRALSPEESALPSEEKAKLLAKQGIRHITAGRIRVVNDAGASVKQDGVEMGEIVIRGNSIMAGYLHNSEATDEAFSGDEFHTGDLAVWHPDGQIEIKDRLKDIIISGGENISTLEVESVLHQHPDVLLAAVVASPDEKWGEVPCAFIEPQPGKTIDEKQLSQFCREHLAGFKIPRKFMVGELPKTATGKIQKYELRKRV